MSSPNITHSDKHKSVAEYLGVKNKTQSKIGNHGKHDSINNSTVHGIKESKKHETTKRHEAMNTHAHSDTRGISRKTDHSEIDHAVFISISAAPKGTSSENPDITEQSQS